MTSFTAFQDCTAACVAAVAPTDKADAVHALTATSCNVVVSPAQKWARGLLGGALLASSALLTACGSVGAGVGVGIPVGPFSIGVGLGSGGLSAGVGTGWGPLGVGVGVNQRGQVTGNAGVGVSTGVGGASVGAGVGTSTVLHDPAQANGQGTPAPQAAEAPQSTPAPPMQWWNARGQLVPSCQVEGSC